MSAPDRQPPADHQRSATPVEPSRRAAAGRVEQQELHIPKRELRGDVQHTNPGATIDRWRADAWR